MQIVARFAINAVLGAMAASNHTNHSNKTMRDLPVVIKMQSDPVFIKSTFQYREIFILYANNTKYGMPDYDTYLAMLGKSELISNIPHDMMDFFPTGDPIKSING